MTRDDISKRAQALLAFWPGTQGNLNDYLLDEAVTRAADNLARDSRCYYGYEYSDVVSGQFEYCAPEIFEVNSLEILDQNNNKHLLMAMTPDQMDAQWGAIWRQPNSQSGLNGLPRYYIQEGENRFRLFPVPNYNAAQGLRVEGYMTPLWPNPDDDCPFPVRDHWTVIYGAAILRAVEMPTDENLARVKGIQMQYDRGFARINREAAQLTGARRYSHYNGGIQWYGGGWGGGY